MPTDLYNQYIYNRTDRKFIAEVDYSLTAPDSKEGGELHFFAENEFSHPDQAMNEIRTNVKIMTAEPGYGRLDGTFMLPLPPEEANFEVGRWSYAMSDENGVFTEPLVIERIFDEVQTFNVLGIYFDVATNNYCTDFEVFFYGSFDELISHKHITDNTQSYARVHAGENIYRVVIKLHKTSEPFRYARIVELDFGLVLEYRDDVIQSVNLINEANPDGKTFPLSSFRLSILNKGLYDQLDDFSYAPYFQKRQRFEYRLGLVIPDGQIIYVECGTYFLQTWTVADDVVDFNASGRTAIFENNMFFDSSLQEFTIAQLVNRFITQANINIETPRITGYFGNVNYRRLLAMLSELSCCLVYEDGSNIVQFNDIINSDNEILTRLDYENVYSPPKAQLADYFNGINLSEYEISTEYRQISKTQHQAGSIVIHFSNPVMGTPEYEITDGFELTNIIWHTMYMTATLQGIGTAEIIITGESVTLIKTETFYRAPWHTAREQDYAYKVDLPCMIKTESYPIFRDWFLERRFRMIAKRLTCSIQWVQNPEIDIADLANVKLSNKGNTANMFVVKQELNYTRSLTGVTSFISDIVKHVPLH